ncbi:MAG: AAA family ATPase [Candidatus Methylacidiphilales bacterium]|nr:AAA family ATPase [Candidatus Methylacidiphilales bacterium]
MTSPHSVLAADHLAFGERLRREVLDPMKAVFIGKEEIIDLLGLCLVAGENLFILGPPGTAKSALVHELGQRLEGTTFSYLLTRFTEPNELFGPFDIRRLRDGELVTNTEGMLPEASLVFLDELLNANSAILNSLLTSLNEKVLRRGRETLQLRSLMFVAASNHLPQEEALGALFDRFLLRVHCGNVSIEQLTQVLESGWSLEAAHPSLHANGARPPAGPKPTFDAVRDLRRALPAIDLRPIRAAYVELVHRIRYSGLPISDRRAVKLQRLIAASALLCGREAARLSDLWMLQYIWDTEEQQEILRSLVQKTIAQETAAEGDHPRAHTQQSPDAEALAQDIQKLAERLQALSAAPASTEAAGDAAYLRDRLSILDGRCQWVQDPEHREALTRATQQLWDRLAAHKS